MAIRDMLDRADKVTVIAEIDGVKLVSFEDYRDVAVAGKVMGNKDIGIRTLNPDGTVASSYHEYAAVNLDSWYANRYILTSKKVLKVVTDYRAIKEQATGRVYTSRLIAYNIERIDGVLTCTGADYISDVNFIKEYTHQLDTDGAREVLAAINEFKNKAAGVGTDRLMI